jgi:hypothetical protein
MTSNRRHRVEQQTAASNLASQIHKLGGQGVAPCIYDTLFSLLAPIRKITEVFITAPVEADIKA